MRTKRTNLKALEMVRAIRDRQAERLVGKKPEEIIAFFRRAGEEAVREAKRRREAHT